MKPSELLKAVMQQTTPNERGHLETTTEFWEEVVIQVEALEKKADKMELAKKIFAVIGVITVVSIAAFYGFVAWLQSQFGGHNGY